MVDAADGAGLLSDAMPTSADISDLIRPFEAARIAGVSTRSLANWADAGKLAVVRTLGGERRYRRSDIEALAAPTAGAPA